MHRVSSFDESHLLRPLRKLFCVAKWREKVRAQSVTKEFRSEVTYRTRKGLERDVRLQFKVCSRMSDILDEFVGGHRAECGGEKWRIMVEQTEVL